MVLYRREWEWVYSRLLKMKNPTTEFLALASRVELALKTKKTDPFNISITENQTHWIETRCKLITWHIRPANRKQVPVDRYSPREDE